VVYQGFASALFLSGMAGGHALELEADNPDVELGAVGFVAEATAQPEVNGIDSIRP